MSERLSEIINLIKFIRIGYIDELYMEISF